MESFAGLANGAEAPKPSQFARFGRFARFSDMVNNGMSFMSLISLIMDHPRKMKHFAGHKRKDELWQQSFHPRQGLRP